MADELQTNLHRFLELVGEHQHALPPDLLFAALELGAAMNRHQRESTLPANRLTGLYNRLQDRAAFSAPYPPLQETPLRRMETLAEERSHANLVGESVH